MTRPAALSLHRPLPGARLRIAAFPHAGGGASAFRTLAGALAPHGIELCALQAPGRENRLAAPFAPSVEALAREFADAVLSLPPLPTVLLGHSLGALVAWLAADLCLQAGLAPAALVASGSPAPQLRGETARALPQAALPLRERILALGGVPEPIARDPELFAIFEPAIRADLDLAARYRHRAAARLPCAIHVYSGTRDAAAPPGTAAGWQALTVQPLRRRAFEGGHFFLYEKPEAVAAALREDVG